MRLLLSHLPCSTVRSVSKKGNTGVKIVTIFVSVIMISQDMNVDVPLLKKQAVSENPQDMKTKILDI